MLLKVHPVQRCELSCHLLTCLIVQKGYVKVGRLYRWRTGEVPGQTERETERQTDRQRERERCYNYTRNRMDTQKYYIQ